MRVILEMIEMPPPRLAGPGAMDIANPSSLALSALLALTLAHPAAAETFTCSFTEPWIKLTYSTATRTVVSEDAPPARRTVLARNVSLRRDGRNALLWVSARGAVIARLELTGHGTDGMSETLYPYSIKTTLVRFNSGGGGCATSLLRTRRAP
jgi:hypothetical protein